MNTRLAAKVDTRGLQVRYRQTKEKKLATRCNAMYTEYRVIVPTQTTFTIKIRRRTTSARIK